MRAMIQQRARVSRRVCRRGRLYALIVLGLLDVPLCSTALRQMPPGGSHIAPDRCARLRLRADWGTMKSRIAMPVVREVPR